MERRRYTDAPAFWCCVSAEPGGVLAARRCARLPAGSPVLRALCTDRSMCERRCSARAAKVDSLHYLLAAGRAGCPAAARPAALCVGQHVPGRYKVRLPALELSRPHTTLTLSTSTRSHRTTVHHCLQCCSFAHFRSAYRLRWAPAAAVAATVERLAACVCGCVCVCVCIVGSSSQRFRQRKPRSI